MKKILLTLALLAFATPALALVQLNVTVPSSGTAFNFDQDGSSHDWAVTGILGIAGDNQADVTSGHALLTDTPTTGSLYTAITADPCGGAKTDVAIATSSGNVQLVAGVSAKKVYICSFSVVGATAAVVNIIEGTGAACTTSNEAAIIGSTTAASGMSFAANSGISYGSGSGTIGLTATAANGICLLQSGTAALAGNITYVQQ